MWAAIAYGRDVHTYVQDNKAPWSLVAMIRNQQLGKKWHPAFPYILPAENFDDRRPLIFLRGWDIGLYHRYVWKRQQHLEHHSIQIHEEKHLAFQRLLVRSYVAKNE
jgi:hypothetical protein